MFPEATNRMPLLKFQTSAKARQPPDFPAEDDWQVEKRTMLIIDRKQIQLDEQYQGEDALTSTGSILCNSALLITSRRSVSWTIRACRTLRRHCRVAAEKHKDAHQFAAISGSRFWSRSENGDTETKAPLPDSEQEAARRAPVGGSGVEENHVQDLANQHNIGNTSPAAPAPQ